MLKEKFAILYRDEVDSTNLWAAREAEKGAANGTLFVAKRQSAGRGRLKRTWQSEGKGLYMTLLMRPDVEARELMRAPLLTALAVREALRMLDAEANIKWPNDVVVGERKICGILCESRVEGMRAAWCVAGAGINLLQREEDFAPELRGKATSLWLLLAREIPRERVIKAFLASIERWYSPCFANDKTFWDAYRAASATLGRDVCVLEGDARWKGRAVDIRPDGALMVEVDGAMRTVYAGDVSIRGLHGYV